MADEISRKGSIRVNKIVSQGCHKKTKEKGNMLSTQLMLSPPPSFMLPLLIVQKTVICVG